MQRMNTKFVSQVAAIILICLTLTEGRAQTVTSGAIRGKVLELVTRAPVIGATVTVTNLETGLIRTSLTSTNGEYFVSMLPVGVYTVSGSMQGYEVVPTSTAKITVRILEPSIVTPPPVELRKIAATGVTPAQP